MRVQRENIFFGRCDNPSNIPFLYQLGHLNTDLPVEVQTNGKETK